MHRRHLLLLILAALLLIAADASAAIEIEPEGGKVAGDRIVINGTTNFAPGNRVLVEVTALSFAPASKTAATGTSGASGIATVEAGEPRNTWTFAVDTTGFAPGEYPVRAEVLDRNVTETATFSLQEPGNGTATPAPQTTTATIAPTASPTTTAPAPTQTPQAGIGAARRRDCRANHSLGDSAVIRGIEGALSRSS